MAAIEQAHKGPVPDRRKTEALEVHPADPAYPDALQPYEVGQPAGTQGACSSATPAEGCSNMGGTLRVPEGTNAQPAHMGASSSGYSSLQAAGEADGGAGHEDHLHATLEVQSAVQRLALQRGLAPAARQRQLEARGHHRHDRGHLRPMPSQH